METFLLNIAQWVECIYGYLSTKCRVGFVIRGILSCFFVDLAEASRT